MSRNLFMDNWVPEEEPEEELDLDFEVDIEVDEDVPEEVLETLWEHRQAQMGGQYRIRKGAEE